MDVNCWLGCGRLTKDSESSVTQKGTSMTKFRMAVNNRRNDDTLFLNVLCFGKMAESLGQHLTKGKLVSVQGKIKVDTYEDKTGATRDSICVLADEISLGPKSDNGFAGVVSVTEKTVETPEATESAPF